MMGMIAKGHVTGELWVVYGVFLSFRPVSGFRFYFYFFFRGKKKKKKKRTRGSSGTSSFYGAVSA